MSFLAPSSWRWHHDAEIASTQDVAIGAARAGEAGRLAVIADRQTAGRGSRGRAWQAPMGNLNLSVLLRPVGARPDSGHWALLAGVALLEALAPYASGLMLKWPNDVLRDGAKLGGVLIDSALSPDGLLDWVVIGLGANLAEVPCVQGRATACLPSPAPPARDVAGAVLRHLDDFALADIRAAWLARAHPPGTEIDVVTPTRRLTGRFAGLTASGALLLQNHPTPISSAEIFVQPVKTGGLGGKALLPQPCLP